MQVAKQQGEYLAGLLGKGACKPGQPMNGVKGFRCGSPHSAFTCFWACAIRSLPQGWQAVIRLRLYPGAIVEYSYMTHSLFQARRLFAKVP